MWTPTTRKQHSRANERYESDLTDEEWRVIEPHLPVAQSKGRPWAWSMREIVNGIFYVMRAGCPWRAEIASHREGIHSPQTIGGDGYAAASVGGCAGFALTGIRVRWA